MNIIMLAIMSPFIYAMFQSLVKAESDEGAFCWGLLISVSLLWAGHRFI